MRATPFTWAPGARAAGPLMLAALAAASCARPANDAGGVLPAELQRVLDEYEAAWRAGDAEALSRLFTEDAVVVTNSSACGPSASRAEVARCYEGQGGPLALRAVSHDVDGRIAYIIGEYAEDAGDPPTGKFVLTLERDEAGRWLIVADMDRAYRQRR